MEKTCIVDFDKTLLKVDSIGFLLKQEHLYLVPSIFFWGVVLWFGKHLLPRARQIGMRRRLKFNILKELAERGEQEILQTYTPLLASYIDDTLVQKVQKEYSRVLVVSSSWQPLIESILRYKQISTFVVHGTVATKELSDFVPCWYTNKLPVLEQHQIQQFDLFTDSRDDGPLVQRAERVEWIRHKTSRTLPSKILLAIIILAALVRLCGVKFGLPFWVVGDEPSVIFAALKMLQLKTLIPSLHVSEFVGNFYYGPYLPYLYLVPFAVVTGVSALFFSGSFGQLTALLTIDPSPFFIIARLISIGLGTITVWLVYVWVQQMTKADRPALFSALFLALSLMHINFSLWARHWVVAGCLFALVGCVLSSRMKLSKRYAVTASLVGLGMGVSIQAALIGGYAVLWALCVDRVRVSALWKESWVWKSGGIAAGLTVLSYLLWPYAFGFLHSDGGAKYPTIMGLWQHLQTHALNLFRAEPLLILFAIFGVYAWYRRSRGMALLFTLFTILYVSTLYVMVGSNGRFIMMLYPLLAVLSGVGCSYLYDLLARASRRVAIGVSVMVIVVLLIVAGRFDYLLLKNDTRAQAYTWLREHTTSSTTIVVAAPLMRLPTTAEYIEEQQMIDPSSVRTFEKALLSLPETIPEKRFRSLNLYSVESKAWYQAFVIHMQERMPEYILVNDTMIESRGVTSILPGVIVHTWNGMQKDLPDQERLPNGFGSGLHDLFTTKNLGPTILIYTMR